MTNDMQAGMMYGMYIVMMRILVFYSSTLLGGIYHHGFESGYSRRLSLQSMFLLECRVTWVRNQQ